MKTKKIFYHLISFLTLTFLVLFLPKIIFAAEGITVPETGLPSPSGGIKDILSNVLTWILGIIGMIAIISFAVSGFQYFFAAGDEKRMETAKRNLTYSILGVIVALSGLIIIKAVDTALRGSSSI
jgi:hypothetical protein